MNRVKGVLDFATSSGTARSAPNALLATNATIGQDLFSPVIDLGDWLPEAIEFSIRRSSTFTAPVVVDASTDSGSTYTVPVGDTLVVAGTMGYVRTSFPFPRELTGKKGVRFRWRILPVTTGTTGTFRIDDVLLVVRPAHDLALIGLRLQPDDPDELSPVSALVTITNRGGAIPRPVTVHLHWDIHTGRHPGGSVETSAVVDSLAAGDSVATRIPLGQMLPGTGTLVALVSDTMDQNRTNDTLTIPVQVGCRRGSAVVNEIMYAPSNSEPEWVEILNVREDSLSIQMWTVSDAVVASRHTIVFGSLTLPPGGYALLTRDTVALREAHPSIRVPFALVQGFPSLNNSGDAVVIADQTGRVMDSVSYDPTWGGGGGHSLERVDCDAPSTLRSNWGSSKNPGGSTPGDSNSIGRKAYDIVLDSVTATPARVGTGDTLLLTACAHNAGRMAAYAGNAEFFRCPAGDTSCGSGTLLGVVSIPGVVPPLGAVRASVVYCPQRSGSLHGRVNVQSPMDEDLSNNSSGFTVIVDHPPGAIRINEIMFDPMSGLPEWVELMNVSADTVDLADWRIGNRNTTFRYRLPGDAGEVPPAGFHVVTRDSASLLQEFGACPVTQVSSLPVSLWNNTADAVVVGDERLLTVDSVWYSLTWKIGAHGSLERRDASGLSTDSSNWGPTADPAGATPGKRNSIAILSHDLCARRVWGTMHGQCALVLHLVVMNAGKSIVSGYGAEFYAVRGTVPSANEAVFLGKVTVQQSLAPRDSCEAIICWEKPPSGVFTVTATVDTAGDQRPGNNSAQWNVAIPFPPGTFVINELMYDPRPGDAEYVEFVNCSATDVDIAGWVMAGHPSASGGATRKVVLSPGTLVISPGGYLVAASDSGILSTFPSLYSCRQSSVRIGSWGSFGLSNSGDEVELFDGAGALLDSVVYTPLWHRAGITDPSGHSLERIRPTLGSNDPRNWSTSVDKRGGTPGEPNSIRVGEPSREQALSFSPNPFSPDGDGFEDFTQIHYRAPTPVALVNIKIFDVRGRLVRVLANHEAIGESGDILWDGRNDERQPVRMGVYIVLLEGCDDRGNSRWRARGALVVARKLQ